MKQHVSKQSEKKELSLEVMNKKIRRRNAFSNVNTPKRGRFIGHNYAWGVN